MSRQGLLLPWLGVVHPGRQTPHHAIAAILAATPPVGTFRHARLSGGDDELLLLTVFFTVNTSLVVIKLKGQPVTNTFQVPLPVPIAGAVAALGLLFFVSARALATAIVLCVLGIVLVLFQRFRTGLRDEQKLAR